MCWYWLVLVLMLALVQVLGVQRCRDVQMLAFLY
jgi:hypothetical protein